MARNPRGIETQISMKPTTTFGVAAGGTGWKKLNIYAEGFDPGEGVVDDPELGGDRNNLTDPLQGTPTRPQPSGSLDVALDLNQIGYILSLLCGQPVTDDTDDPVFEHVWTSGQLEPGLAHFEIQQAAAFFKMGDAWTASQISMNLGDEDGYRRVQATMMGRSVRVLNAGVAVSPAAVPVRQKLRAVVGKIQTGATLGALTDLGNVLGGNFTFGNGAFTENYFDDSQWSGSVQIGNYSCSVNPQIRFSDAHYALVNSWDSTTPFAVRMIFEKSADLRMQIDMPNVIANRVLPKAAGVDMMDMSPVFMASQTASAPMCTITIRNQVESYAAA